MNADSPKFLRLAEGRVGLRRLQDAERPPVRLVCLPYAGGQSLAFRSLAEALPADWSIWAVDPPGHGWSAGPPLETVESMVELYLSTLPDDLLAGAILLGHSLGGCVAFELARRLLAGNAGPRALVLSGARPPGHLAEYESFLSLNDAELLECLIKLGGVPPEWADEPEIFDMFKETLRADFRAFEAFQIEGRLSGLPCLSIGGLQDDVCRPHHVFDWSRHCADCSIDFLEGRHMFVQTNADLLARRLVRFVSSLPADN